jgi:hypothetical protein
MNLSDRLWNGRSVQGLFVGNNYCQRQFFCIAFITVSDLCVLQ